MKYIDEIYIYCDGGCKPNPGTMVGAYIILDNEGNVICEGKEFRVFDNYFRNRKIYGTWNNIKIRKVKVFSYHFTYEILIKAIIKNGFEIMDYIDCYPIKKAKKLFPGDYRTCSKIPYFSAWKLKKK